VCCCWQAYPRRPRPAGETKLPFSCGATRWNSRKLFKNTSNKIDFMRKPSHVQTNHENYVCVGAQTQQGLQTSVSNKNNNNNPNLVHENSGK
jgi:hypothetical protein